jgi:hypothetical protein
MQAEQVVSKQNTFLKIERRLVRWKWTAVSEVLLATCFTLVSCLTYSLSLKM